MRVRGVVPMMLVAASLLLGTPDPVRAGVSVGVGVNMGGGFHDSLAVYGSWTNHSRYGSVWAPRHVAVGWRPYTVGHWAYTDYDWTWASDEPWGWATYHYGRWVFDPALGWIWIPGYEWAPAWVTWRFGGGYAGWAPLPPYANAFSFTGIVDPFAFCFVQQRYLAEPFLARHFVPVQRNVTIVNVTKNVTNYTRVNNRIVNRGISPREIERASGHAVPRLKVREVASVPRAGERASVTGHELTVFKPSINRDPQLSQGRSTSDRAHVSSTNSSHVVNRDRADEPRASRSANRFESRPPSSRDSSPSTNRSASDRNDKGRSTNPPSHIVNRDRADEPQTSRPANRFESRPRSSGDSSPSTNRSASDRNDQGRSTNPPSHLVNRDQADEPRASRPANRFESRPRSSGDSSPSTHRPSFESRRGDSRSSLNERPAARPAAPAHRAPSFQERQQTRPSERVRPAPAPRGSAAQPRVDSGGSRSSASRPAQQRNEPSRTGRRHQGGEVKR